MQGKRFFQGTFYKLLSTSIPFSLLTPLFAERLILTKTTTRKTHSTERGLRVFGSAYKNSYTAKQLSTSRILFSGFHHREAQSWNAVNVVALAE